jgi:hypothetical protein
MQCLKAGGDNRKNLLHCRARAWQSLTGEAMVAPRADRCASRLLPIARRTLLVPSVRCRFDVDLPFEFGQIAALVIHPATLLNSPFRRALAEKPYFR